MSGAPNEVIRAQLTFDNTTNALVDIMKDIDVITGTIHDETGRQVSQLKNINDSTNKALEQAHRQGYRTKQLS